MRYFLAQPRRRRRLLGADNREEASLLLQRIRKEHTKHTTQKNARDTRGCVGSTKAGARDRQISHAWYAVLREPRQPPTPAHTNPRLCEALTLSRAEFRCPTQQAKTHCKSGVGQYFLKMRKSHSPFMTRLLFRETLRKGLVSCVGQAKHFRQMPSFIFLRCG